MVHWICILFLSRSSMKEVMKIGHMLILHRQEFIYLVEMLTLNMKVFDSNRWSDLHDLFHG